MQLLTDIICVNNSEMKRNYSYWRQLFDRPFVCRLFTCWAISTKLNAYVTWRIKHIYYFGGNVKSLIVKLGTMYTFFFHITVLVKWLGFQNHLPNLSLYAYLGKGILPFPKCLGWHFEMSNVPLLYKLYNLNMHFYHGKSIPRTPAIFHNGICTRSPRSYPLLISSMSSWVDFSANEFRDLVYAIGCVKVIDVTFSGWPLGYWYSFDIVWVHFHET